MRTGDVHEDFRQRIEDLLATIRFAFADQGLGEEEFLTIALTWLGREASRSLGPNRAMRLVGICMAGNAPGTPARGPARPQPRAEGADPGLRR